MPTDLTGSPTYHNPIPAPVDGEPVTGDSVQQMGSPLIDNDAWFRAILEGSSIGTPSASSGWSSVQLPLNPDNSNNPFGAFIGVATVRDRTEMIAERLPGLSDLEQSFPVPIMQALIGSDGWDNNFEENLGLYWIQTSYASQANILIPVYWMPRGGKVTGVTAIVRGNGWSDIPANEPELYLVRSTSNGTNTIVFGGLDESADVTEFNTEHEILATGTAHTIQPTNSYYILVKGCSPTEVGGTFRLHRVNIYFKRA